MVEMCHPLHRLCFKGIRGRAEAGLAVGREGRNHTDAFPLHLPAGKTMLAMLSVLMSLCSIADSPSLQTATRGRSNLHRTPSITVYSLGREAWLLLWHLRKELWALRATLEGGDVIWSHPFVPIKPSVGEMYHQVPTEKSNWTVKYL